MKHRAFSLLEVAVASSIAAIISTAAISTFAMINKQVVRMKGASVASDHAKSVIDLLTSDLQGIGGGAIRPWMALHVVDDGTASRADEFNPAVGGPVKPDRLTYATAIPGVPTCVVTGPAPADPPAALDEVQVAGEGSCCLDAIFDAREPGAAAQAFLIKGTSYRQITLHTSPTACAVKITRGPLYENDRPEPGENWVGAEVVAARVRTIYLTEDRELRMYRETESTDAAPTNSASENIRLAGNVVDFQVQLGYDINGDGSLLDATTNDDEWRYNVVGDTATMAGFREDALRMIGVGVIVAQPVNDPTYVSTAAIVGSSPIEGPRLQLRAAMGKVALRNLFVFF